MQIVDVSEHNANVDFGALKAAGVDGCIVRLGYGKSGLDSKFYEYINKAVEAGMQIGVYHYSYALDEAAAEIEAQFIIDTLRQSGLTPDRLELGVWHDMEDGDGYKERHGMPTNQTLTNIASIVINRLWQAGYSNAGLYAAYDYIINKLYMDQLGCDIWYAQYNYQMDWQDPRVKLWQYTMSANINGQLYDMSRTV
ncbi:MULTISPECIES: GH25 family lysozyme [Veillonella]|uniref:GH25 family lysozyme n=1 Tax=Veillonella TaxID=29465 RepID=UPI001389B2C3|nr:MULTISPECIES: GH25 family lysozyme [Veillonella]KAF1680500.1 glycosyl hydrolase family 25 [Veillonella sp. R32]